MNLFMTDDVLAFCGITLMEIINSNGIISNKLITFDLVFYFSVNIIMFSTQVNG